MANVCIIAGTGAGNTIKNFYKESIWICAIKFLSRNLISIDRFPSPPPLSFHLVLSLASFIDQIAIIFSIMIHPSQHASNLMSSPATYNSNRIATIQMGIKLILCARTATRITFQCITCAPIWMFKPNTPRSLHGHRMKWQCRTFPIDTKMLLLNVISAIENERVFKRFKPHFTARLVKIRLHHYLSLSISHLSL